jgi:hypothetical protein
MTKGALEDLTTCLHYSDDWDPEDDGVWDDIYDDLNHCIISIEAWLIRRWV